LACKGAGDAARVRRRADHRLGGRLSVPCNLSARCHGRGAHRADPRYEPLAYDRICRSELRRVLDVNLAAEVVVLCHSFWRSHAGLVRGGRGAGFARPGSASAAPSDHRTGPAALTSEAFSKCKRKKLTEKHGCGRSHQSYFSLSKIRVCVSLYTEMLTYQSPSGTTAELSPNLGDRRDQAAAV
jgi:hypothetical protein